MPGFFSRPNHIFALSPPRLWVWRTTNDPTEPTDGRTGWPILAISVVISVALCRQAGAVYLWWTCCFFLFVFFFFCGASSFGLTGKWHVPAGWSWIFIMFVCYVNFLFKICLPKLIILLITPENLFWKGQKVWRSNFGEHFSTFPTNIWKIKLHVGNSAHCKI